jgi:hypothetical protein
MPSSKPRSRIPRGADLARAIGIVLAVKFVALIVIWNLWFAHPQASRLDDERVANTLYSPLPVVQKGTQSNAQP